MPKKEKEKRLPIDGLTVVKIDETWFLGVLMHDGNQMILNHVMAYDEDTEDRVIEEWIKAQNLGTLSKIIIGENQGYIEEPLDEEQTIELGRLWEDMQLVKKTAIARLENSYFERDNK